MIIEFLGMPGSGKTSLVPITLEKLHRLGITAWQDRGGVERIFQASPLMKLVMKLAPGTVRTALTWHLFSTLNFTYRYKFSWDHPGLLEWVANWQQSRPKSVQVDRRHILQKFKQLAGSYAYLSHHLQSDEAIVFDEGLVHKAIQLSVSDVERADPNRIWSYMDLIPKPDWVVILHTPVEESLDRIRQRGVWGHYRHKSSYQLEQFLVNAHDAVELAAERIHYLGWNYIHLDNKDHEFGHTISELNDRLEFLFCSEQEYDPWELAFA